MPDSWVLDASVAAKLCFTEGDSAEAEAAVRSAGTLLAPDLIFVELASVAAKQVRRNGVTIETARQALALAETLLDEAVPLAGLAQRALDFAALHGVSASDGTTWRLLKSANCHC
jgi:predicted nucleic acid-binding protein